MADIALFLDSVDKLSNLVLTDTSINEMVSLTESLQVPMSELFWE